MQHSSALYGHVTALLHDGYAMEQAFDTLILSDVHLGSEVSRAREASELLTDTNFRRLVLLGDIFSDLNFRRLTSDHWKFLSRIRKLSNPKRKVEVVWVEGNHDQGLSQIMSHLVGVPVYQRYVWEFEGKRHVAVHGHQFCRHNEFLSRVGERLFYELQKMEGGRKRISRLIDRINTRWGRMESRVAEGALLYARAGRVDRIFCGHTHVASHQSRYGVDYYNSGSWIDASPTYLTIDEDGVQIRQYECKKIETATPETDVEVLPFGELLDPLAAFSGYESVRC
jgi:UDP-2,3-diacylglucosamine pyrophosphatase LpxH